MRLTLILYLDLTDLNLSSFSIFVAGKARYVLIDVRPADERAISTIKGCTATTHFTESVTALRE